MAAKARVYVGCARKKVRLIFSVANGPLKEETYALSELPLARERCREYGLRASFETSEVERARDFGLRKDSVRRFARQMLEWTPKVPRGKRRAA